MQCQLTVIEKSSHGGNVIDPASVAEEGYSLCIVAYQCTVTFDAGRKAEGAQRGTAETCRISFTIPQSGTIVVWGHAAKTLRIKLHEHENAAAAIGTCGKRYEQEKLVIMVRSSVTKKPRTAPRRALVDLGIMNVSI